MSTKKGELEAEVNAKREGRKEQPIFPLFGVSMKKQSMHQGETMDGSKVWTLMLITQQKWLATHRGNIPSKKTWVEENEKALEYIKLK